MFTEIKEYNGADGKNLASKKDAEDEIKYIKSGDLDGLKSHEY